MKICGLITEYNPFHNGHLYHMEEARRLSGCDYLVVVMSGDFVQRGEPAVIHKYARTRMALECGADLVLELPALFSSSSAEVFASSAVALLDSLGCVDHICFGAETGDLSALSGIADVLTEEPPAYIAELQKLLRTGQSYPSARSSALSSLMGPEIGELLTGPNNILAVEYLKAIRKYLSSMRPLLLRRFQTNHLDPVPFHEAYASAGSLRSMMEDPDRFTMVRSYVPESVFRLLEKEYRLSCPVTFNDLSLLLSSAIFSEKEHLQDYLDLSPDLADRIRNLFPGLYSPEGWIDALKTRAYTRTRISRSLLHLCLGMKAADLSEFEKDRYCLYARILGLRKASGPLFHRISENISVPLISKPADAEKLLDPRAYRLFLTDLRASDLYRALVFHKFGTVLPDDLTASVVVR